METIILVLAALATGIMAGIFFTWTNAVTPGIGKLSDLEYLKSLQSMNRVILNPTFKLIFFAPVLLIPLTTVLSYKDQSFILWILLSSSLLYGIGCFGVTIGGNIPLNNLLENSNLEAISLEEAKNLREMIELKWNKLNLVRTITSIAAFALLILTCIQINQQI